MSFLKIYTSYRLILVCFFKRELLLKDSILVIKNSFDIQRTTFPKEEYPMVRDYFKKIYGVISEPIILKKK